MSVIELKPSQKLRQACELAQGADVADRVAVEEEHHQAREPAQGADVADRVAEDKERQAREPTQGADIDDRGFGEEEARQACEILDPHQALDPGEPGIKSRQHGYQTAGEILLRIDLQRGSDDRLQVGIRKRRDGRAGVIAAKLGGLEDQHPRRIGKVVTTPLQIGRVVNSAAHREKEQAPLGAEPCGPLGRC